MEDKIEFERISLAECESRARKYYEKIAGTPDGFRSSDPGAAEEGTVETVNSRHFVDFIHHEYNEWLRRCYKRKA